MTFKTLPKVELHLHLEGAAPPAFIRDLAREKNIDVSGIFDGQGGYVFENFEHFLKVYEAACEPLTSPEDFYRLTSAVLEETASHGVVYAETFISPDFCGGGDVAAWRDYLDAMAQAAQDCEASHGITLKGIVTCIRHEGPEQAKRAAKCAVETMGDFLTGFGMAGAEMMHRPADFAYSFDMAREAGLPLTCHAGEWGGPDMVAETLDALKVARIGHGINAVRDADLVKRLADEGIVLEVCPGSNVVLKAVENWAAHPIAKLRDAGVPVTVSTDDPPFFHTTITAEYDNLHQTFGWVEGDFLDLNKVAMNAAFCDTATRDRILKRLDDA
ncbi:adenosine deaminase [Yoonia sp. R2331]|uniref:adenosine deaminase n=1 Tax=Yoonia sp. R2331 TaxID=3237238 RepID=UPI0034E58CED